MLRRLITHHPLVNILFIVVLVLGIVSFLEMPRENDPDVNFNWVIISTIFPGASSKDIEDLVTSPLEDALGGVKDLRFVSSNSRQNASTILVRFEDMPRSEFLTRFSDLRRDVQNKARAELPDDAEDPVIVELTTSSGFPTAMVVVVGQADDEELREVARSVSQDIERIAGVDDVVEQGLNEPELQVNLNLQELASRGLTAVEVADSLRGAFRDVSAGSVPVAGGEWIVRVDEADPDPERLAKFKLVTPGGGQLTLDQVASVERVRKKPTQKVSVEGRPAVSLAITKQKFVNTIKLVDSISAYVEQQNTLRQQRGIELILADDQTVQTREALNVMGRNAALGLMLVLFVCWMFLGIRIASMVTMGIGFSIAGTMWALNITGNTLNVPVLLGIVIVLGMLVDDAVVVVEAIYYRLQRGVGSVEAALQSLHEVGAPVASAVATTMAAFLPLMLLKGIVGQFMFVIPFVVTVGLAVSLVEAFWILPAHVIGLGDKALGGAGAQNWRVRWTSFVRKKYTFALTYVMRRPWVLLLVTGVLLIMAFGSIAVGRVTIDFFQSDPLRLIYVNVDMPPDSSLDNTLAHTEKVERRAREKVLPHEIRAITSMAGLKFTETEAFYGDKYGQIQISLNPRGRDGRTVGEVMEELRNHVVGFPGDGEITLMNISGGPPTLSDINVKVRNNDYAQLRAAADHMIALLKEIPAASDISDDDAPGRLELTLDLNETAIRQAGLDPGKVARLVGLHIDGEIISFIRFKGEKMELRVRGAPRQLDSIETVLDDPIALPRGGSTTLRELSTTRVQRGSGSIRHYNFRRAITVSADIDERQMNAQQANDLLKEKWAAVRAQHGGTDTEYGGVLDDIEESLDGMKVLFVFGLGLMYLILATQFRSYFQPLLILSTVPMAFTGVVLGLAITGNPLSLFSLYGVVALTGIAVNSAIVMIDAANHRIKAGMRPLHATVYAARRRVIPVLMTAMTTIAGLFSLAVGLGGKSLIWGPVASSIVAGLFVASALTLFVVPVLYRFFMKNRAHPGWDPEGDQLNTWP